MSFEAKNDERRTSSPGAGTGALSGSTRGKSAAAASPVNELTATLTRLADRLEKYLLTEFLGPHGPDGPDGAAELEQIPLPHWYGLGFLRASLLLASQHGLGSASRADVAKVEALITPETTENFLCSEFLWYSVVADWINAGQPPNDQPNLYPDWPTRYMNPDVTNWRLMRLVVDAVRERLPIEAIDCRVDEIARRYGWTADGLLRDERGTNSLCYHAFSTSLLGDLAELGSPTAERWHELARSVCRSFVLTNGQAMLIGRGQEQIFGYASLITVLARGLQPHAAAEIHNELQRVLEHLGKFQRADGGFPLVLRGGPQPDGRGFQASQLRSPEYAGWYAYNTAWDYQPFLLWQLRRCQRWLSERQFVVQRLLRQSISPATETAGHGETETREFPLADRQAVIWRRGEESLLVAVPLPGYWTDGQPTPWVSDFPLPLCGTDHLAARFDPAQLPLPGGSLEQTSWRESLPLMARKICHRIQRIRNSQPRGGRKFDFWQRLEFQFVTSDSFVGTNPLVEMRRRWSWQPGQLIIRDELHWRRTVRFANFSPVRLAVAELRSRAAGWDVMSRPVYSAAESAHAIAADEHQCRAKWGQLQITRNDELRTVPSSRSVWTVRSILTADGVAKLLEESLATVTYHAGDVVRRDFAFHWPVLRPQAAAEHVVTDKSPQSTPAARGENRECSQTAESLEVPLNKANADGNKSSAPPKPLPLPSLPFHSPRQAEGAS